MFAFHEHPVTGLDTAISPWITTPVPGRVSNAGKRQEPRNTRTFQAVGAVTKPVGELDNVRYVRREIGVAKFPLRLGGWCPPGGTPNVDKALLMVSSLNPACCNAWMHCAFSSSEGSGIR